LSAYNRAVRRPDFERLLADLQAHALDVVVVWRSDRFTRQPRDLERFLDLAEKRKVQLVSVTEPFDASNGMGLLMLRQFVAFGHYESAVKAERVQRKMAELAKAGRPHKGGTRPFGFHDDRVTVRTDEAAVIRAVARRVLAGESMRGVVADLNRRGIKTPKGGSWSISPLRRVLLSKRLAGIRAHRTGTFKAAWRPILDQTTHERLVALFSSPARQRFAPRSKYALSGLVRCGSCEQRLITHWRYDNGNGGQPKKRYYVCPGGDRCERGVRVLAGALEEVVSKALIVALDSLALARALRKSSKGSRDDRELVAQLRVLEEQLDRAERGFVEGLLRKPSFLKVRGELEDEIGRVRSQLARRNGNDALALLPGSGAALRRAWEQRDDEWRRALVAAVIDRIIVRPVSRGGTFDPSRVDLLWRV
jgi:DNA invertase Pin-like site-specific DNA recombinase